MRTKISSLLDNQIFRMLSCDSKLLIILREIYLAQFMLKIFIILIMELFYARIKTKLDQIHRTREPPTNQSSNPLEVTNDKSDFEAQVETLRNLIIWSSPMRPELIVSSIFMHGLYVSPLIPFHYLHRITTRFYDPLRYPLFKYLQNEPLGKQGVERELDDVINELVISNSNYAATLVRLRMNHVLRRRQMIISDQIDNFKHKHHGKLLQVNESYLQVNNKMEIYQHDSANLELNSNIETNGLQFIDNELEIIRQEYNYLQSLLYDKESIWPENRTEKSISDLKKKWLKLNYSALGNMTVNNLMIVMFFIKTSGQYRSERNLNQQFSLMRSLTHLDMYLVLIITNEYFARPLIDFVLGQMDLVLLINEFRCRVRSFQNEVAKTFSSQKNITIGDFDNDEGNLGPRYRCNCKCLQAYITLRLIMSHSIPMKLNGQAIILQLIFVVMTASGCVLVCITQLNASEHDSVKFLGLALMIVVNVFLTSYAALNAYLLTVIKLIWSLLESSIIHEEVSQDESDEIEMDNDNDKDKSMANIWTHKLHIDDGTKKSYARNRDKYNVTYSAHSKQYTIISPHLLNLWQRLVHHDQAQLVKLFTCELFGMFPIDYHNLIKLNFWLTSLFMIYFAL